MPLHLLLNRIEDIDRINQREDRNNTPIFTELVVRIDLDTDLNTNHDDADKEAGNGTDKITDARWRSFLESCFNLIASLKENTLQSWITIRCFSRGDSLSQRLICAFEYHKGMVDFVCSDLPGPIIQKVNDNDLGFAEIAPYVNKMGPWILEYVPILRPYFYRYPNITEISLPYWSWTIVEDYFSMLADPSSYVTTISYYREQYYRILRVANKLEAIWSQIPHCNIEKQISLILPFRHYHIRNVMQKFPSCRRIGILKDNPDTNPAELLERFQMQYHIEKIILYVPLLNASGNTIAYPTIPNISYLTYTKE